MHMKGCEETVPLTLTSYYISGNWVVRGSRDPNKFLFYFLGPNKSGKYCPSSNKDLLNIHFQQFLSNQLSADIIEALIVGNYYSIENCQDLDTSF